MTDEEYIARLKAQIAEQERRLDYAVMQLNREAKFLPTWKPENARFYRALGCVTEVRDSLAELARLP